MDENEYKEDIAELDEEIKELDELEAELPAKTEEALEAGKEAEAKAEAEAETVELEKELKAAKAKKGICPECGATLPKSSDPTRIILYVIIAVLLIVCIVLGFFGFSTLGNNIRNYGFDVALNEQSVYDSTEWGENDADYETFDYYYFTYVPDYNENKDLYEEQGIDSVESLMNYAYEYNAMMEAYYSADYSTDDSSADDSSADDSSADTTDATE